MAKRSPRSVKASCDRLFSQLIRSKGKCERCSGTDNLQCAHIHSRKYGSVRFHPLNAVCLDAKCHRWAHDNPTQFTYWLEQEFGKAQLEYLELLKNEVCKRKLADWLELEAELKAKLK